MGSGNDDFTDRFRWTGDSIERTFFGYALVTNKRCYKDNLNEVITEDRVLFNEKALDDFWAFLMLNGDDLFQNAADGMWAVVVARLAEIAVKLSDNVFKRFGGRSTAVAVEGLLRTEFSFTKKSETRHAWGSEIVVALKMGRADEVQTLMLEYFDFPTSK